MAPAGIDDVSGDRYTANGLNQLTTAGPTVALTYDGSGNLSTDGTWIYK